MEDTEMRIPSIQLTQHGQKLYLATLPSSVIVDEERVQVDYYNAKTKKGYQRRPTLSRARDFARYISKAHGISPTTILVSVRNTKGRFKAINGNDIMGYLDFPNDTVFWIVDGQHRAEGFRTLFTSGDESFDAEGFHVPVVIMNVDNDYDEAKQFIIVNKTQKGVKSDLAEHFVSLMFRREKSQDLANLPRETTREIEWRPRATDIIDILNTRISDKPKDDFFGNPWYGKIQEPNEPKGDTVVSRKSLGDSLKLVLNSDAFRDYTTEELATLLVRYWRALESIYPQAFAEPELYLIQRTSGVFVLHRIFPRAAGIAGRNEKRLTKEQFEEVLRNMGEEFTDSMFWSTNGVVGLTGTSQKGFGILAAKLGDALEAGNSETGSVGRPFAL
jgi:DGQHR domain-containing protein